MKFIVLIALATLALVQAKPTSPLGGQFHQFGGQFPGFGFQHPSSAQGASTSGITSGQQVGIDGTQSQISAQQAQTGGTAQGNAVNAGGAFTTQQQTNGLLGNQNSADVGSVSQQTSQPNFGPGFGFPPGFFGRPSSATGNANSMITSGTSIGPGGASKITSLTSSASGTAENGGSSSNAAGASSQSTDGIFGTTSIDSTNVQSVQTGRR